MAELLAKPDQGLLEHLLEVAELGKEIAQRLNLDKSFSQRAVLACLLHDIGKATRSFQEYVRQKRSKAYPHALAALVPALVAELKALGPPPIAAAAVLTHHSPLTAGLYQHFTGPPDYVRDFLALLQRLFDIVAQEGFQNLPDPSEIEPLLRESPAGIIDSDFAFCKERKSLRGVFQELPRRDFAAVKTVLHLADWLASARKPDPDSIFLKDGSEKIQEHLISRGFKLRTFQKQARGLKEEPLRLRAPTGTGKTEALLLWAGDAKRIIYLLPTQATVNAMWRRLRKIYGDDAVGIAHGRSGYILRKEFEEEPLDHKLFASVFAKPVMVATLDQYLFGHLHGRHWEERLTLSRGATVILDEIHAYEPYTLGLLHEALNRDPPARLALASATLPDHLMELYGRENLIEAEPELWERRRHRLDLRETLLEENLDEVLSLARDGRRILVIANTVRTAQAIYKALIRAHPEEKVRLLHSRFIFRDRQEKERLVENPEPGTILVATQVVEVSLDISYDVLFTEIAPVDALVQRMGRVNRKGDAPPAPVVVFLQWERGSEWVYGKELLGLSRSIVEGLSPCPTDWDLAEATNKLYRDVAQAPEYMEEIKDGKSSLDYIQKTLGCYTIDLSEEDLRARFVTRKGYLSIDTLPEKLLDEAYHLLENREKWRIMELLVPVPGSWLHAYKERFYWSEDFGIYVTTLPYDPELGLQPPEEERPSSHVTW